MLLRLFYLTVIVSLCSCHKAPPPAPTAGSVSFSINGTSYSWIEQQGQNAGNAETYMTMSIYASPTGTYHLYISNVASIWLIPLKELSLTFQAASLTTNTPLTLTNTIASNPDYPHSVVVFPSTVYEEAYVFTASEIGDYASITFTSIHDNRASGRFNAQLTRRSDKSKIDITNGAFRDVEISH